MKDEAAYPNENVLRFVKHRGLPERGWGTALDIGSGGGANARALRTTGWAVHTVDLNPATEADFHEDIRDFNMLGFYDLILDCNTLCHVEDAPYQKIHDMLDGEGWFFSIHPTRATVPLIAAGRWTRKASEWDMRESLKMFSRVKVDHASYPDPRRGLIESYVITADK
jgi:hypothetical protein